MTTVPGPDRTAADPATAVARYNEAPFHRYLGLVVEEAASGSARVQMPVGPETPRGSNNSVHGGILATLVDTASLYALTVSTPPGRQLNGTAELNLSYLRPALGAHITAEAEVVKFGRSLAVAEVSIRDDAGRLCVRGRATYAVRETDPAPAAG